MTTTPAAAAATPALDAETAIGYLMATGGNAQLAASRMSRELGQEINDARLLATIAKDPDGAIMLFNQVKVFALLSALDVFRLMQIAVTQQIPDLKPRDTATSFVNLLRSLGELSRSVEVPRNDTNPLDAVLKGLPPEAAEAVEFFLKHPKAGDDALDNLPALPTPQQTASASRGATPSTHPVTELSAASTPAYRSGRDVTRDAA